MVESAKMGCPNEKWLENFRNSESYAQKLLESTRHYDVAE